MKRPTPYLLALLPAVLLLGDGAAIRTAGAADSVCTPVQLAAGTQGCPRGPIYGGTGTGLWEKRSTTWRARGESQRSTRLGVYSYCNFRAIQINGPEEINIESGEQMGCTLSRTDSNNDGVVEWWGIAISSADKEEGGSFESAEESEVHCNAVCY